MNRKQLVDQITRRVVKSLKAGTTFCTFTAQVEIVIPHGKKPSSSEVKRLLEKALDGVTPMADVLQFRVMKTSTEEETVFCTFSMKAEIVIPRGKQASAAAVKKLLETALDRETPMVYIEQFRLVKTSTE